MPIWLIVIAAGVGLYLVAGGPEKRPRVAEGRSWRLVPGASTLKLANMPDAAARFVGEHAWLMVKIARKDGPERVPVLVVADRQIGPSAIAGRFLEDLDHPIPSPWGPKPETPLEFALEDVVLIVKD